MTRLYFAYGSNMDTAQMERPCPAAELIGSAVLPAFAFLINSRGVASIRPDSGRNVWGLLWSLSVTDELALDRYEGVNTGAYEKAEVSVRLNGKPELALVYIATDDTPGTPRPTYLERILEAAYANDFPAAYVSEVRQCARTSN